MDDGDRVLATNRQARHRYSLSDDIECGIALTGSEVKSLRESKVTLTEAWGSIVDGEAWLHGLHIAPYSHAQQHSGHEPTRDRKLLLHRHQIDRLRMKMQLERLTLVPTKLYLSNGRVKVQMALGKGKTTVDKRHDLAERQSEREAQRDIAAARHAEAGIVSVATGRFETGELADLEPDALLEDLGDTDAFIDAVETTLRRRLR